MERIIGWKDTLASSIIFRRTFNLSGGKVTNSPKGPSIKTVKALSANQHFSAEEGASSELAMGGKGKKRRLFFFLFKSNHST